MSLEWREADDVTPADLGLTVVTPPGPAVEKHLWNPSTATSIVRNILVRPQARLTGTDPDTGLPYLWRTSGLPPLTQRWVQMRQTGTTGPASPPAVRSPWFDTGDGAFLPVQDLPADSAAVIEVRLNPPLGTAVGGYEVTLQVVDDPATGLPSGLSETFPDGIASHLGDPAASFLFGGGTIAPSSPVADTVEAPYAWGVQTGVPFGIPAATITPGATDGASASLGAGEGYWALLGITAGARTVTKGLKAASSSAVKPAVPAGTIPLAYVLRDDSGLINSGDIVQAWALGRFSWISSSGAVATISGGWARVDNSWVATSVAQTIDLTLSATNTVFLLRNGSLEANTTGEEPERRSVPLYQVTCDGSGVTAIIDLRPFVGHREERLLLRPASGADGEVSPLELAACNRPLLVDPEQSIAFAVGSLGGNTSGVLRVDVQFIAPGGSWSSPTSLFPDTASMPQLAFGATELVTRACKPSVCVIPAGSRVRAVVANTLAGGSAPTDLLLVLWGATR